jgi:asparagine synthase (glutamine-hydrolysing)
MSDVPIGVLPGGFFINSAIAERDGEQGLHSFSIGLDADLDAVAARKVADFLATEHHEIYFSVEEGIKIL